MPTLLATKVPSQAITAFELPTNLKHNTVIAKFADVSADPKTKILFRQVSKFGEVDVLDEKWVWDGIKAESLIFANSDIADKSLAALERKVRESPLVIKNQVLL